MAENGESPNLSLYLNGESSFYCILKFEQDSIHEVGSKMHRVKKGECLFVPPGSIQKFAKEREYKGVIYIFTEYFMLRYGSISTSNYLCERRKRIINDSVVFNIINNIDVSNVIFEYSNIGQNYKDSVIGTMFVTYILRMFETNMTDQHLTDHYFSKNKIFYTFNQLLISRKIKSRDAKEYAKEMNISYGILNRACKDCVNWTPKNCIDYVLIVEAKRQLLITNRSVKEIALDLNFDETSNFSRYFKRHTGVLPHNYKDKIYKCNNVSSD